MSAFTRILRYAKPYRANIVFNIVFNLLATVFSLASIGLVIPLLGVIFENTKSVPVAPVYNGDLLSFLSDTIAYQMGIRVAESGQAAALLFVCTIVIIAFFFKNLFRYLALFIITPLRNGITRDIRSELHAKILKLPIGFFTEQRKGDIISRMTTDLKEVEWSVLRTLEIIFKEPVMIIGSLAILVYMSPQLTLFVFITLPIIFFVISKIGRSLKRSSVKAQNQMGELMSQTEENVSGLKVIKAFNAEDLKQGLFQTTIDHYYKLMNKVMRKSDIASPLSEFMGTMVMAIVIWYGGSLVIEDPTFTPEAFIAYLLFFYQIIPPSKSLSQASYHIQQGNASSERVLEILDAENPIKDAPGALPIESFEKEIVFENVSFSYTPDDADAKQVLNDVSLKIVKGKTIALVGQSGSGKTTLTNLVPRFYDITSGSLKIDGNEIRDCKIHDLRNLLGIVTQESLLFNESVAYNIALGKPEASDEEIMAAAKIANAHEFIKDLEKGYQTNIGDGGSKLSGGQKQRLSIARAVLKNPPILILDEATSALDTESEKLVQDALFKLMQNRTSLVIAHRLSTIQNADEIIVMDQGQIAERGNHQELLAAEGIYKKLVEMQSFG